MFVWCNENYRRTDKEKAKHVFVVKLNDEYTLMRVSECLTPSFEHHKSIYMSFIHTVMH